MESELLISLIVILKGGGCRWVEARGKDEIFNASCVWIVHLVRRGCHCQFFFFLINSEK